MRRSSFCPTTVPGPSGPAAAAPSPLGNVHVADVLRQRAALRFEAEDVARPPANRGRDGAHHAGYHADVVTRYSVLAADPRKQITLQNEQVTGRAGPARARPTCTIEDDQGNTRARSLRPAAPSTRHPGRRSTRNGASTGSPATSLQQGLYADRVFGWRVAGGPEVQRGDRPAADHLRGVGRGRQRSTPARRC